MKTKFLGSLIVLALFAGVHQIAAQGTAFTYQGQLQNHGSPANGLYDFQFLLSNAPSGGSQIGSTLTVPGVGVTNGLFITTLDFGLVFAGNPAWLAINVRSNGIGGYVGLYPLQQLTPTPNAIYAENAKTLANGVAIGSGMGNTIASGGTMDSFIGGGNANNIQPGSLDSAVGGGQNNMIQPNSAFSFIGGGLNNQAGSEWSVIGGGNGNVINMDPTGAPTMASTIGGGLMNSNIASYATVAGGFGNVVSGMYASIGGGSNNVASGYASVVGGGDPNYALAPFSSVLGGNRNSASGDHATVGGGSYNGASGTGSTVAGGEQNSAHGDYSTIGGGEQNAANGTEATVSGGTGSNASGPEATVGGGQQNVASGQYGAVPGGYNNTASGLASFAAGYKASAGQDNSFVWSDGGPFFGDPFGFYNADYPKQFKIQAQNGVRIDVSGSSGVNPAALFVNSVSANGVGLYVLQTNSSDACVVLNSYNGDIIKGFGSSGAFGGPNTLVFYVTVFGDVYAHSFNSTSDRNAKENFSSISPAEILDKVASLPVSQWNFKGEQKEVQHIGPMAQDFHAAFGLDGTEDKRISLTDEGGVALAAIQGLNQKLIEKDGEIQTLKQQNDSLAERLNELEATVKQLAAQK
jgi:hypothetical protein